MVLGVTLATAAGADTRSFKTPQSGTCDTWRLASAAPGGRLPSEEHVLITNKGNCLPLYKWSAEAREFMRFATRSEQQYMRDFPSIRRESASDQTNCHGWVFTQGRHLVFGTEVEQILCDNGYYVVEQPTTNDVIIYRNSRGMIVHSGIVQAVLADGTVMIESKWGISARYLHLPAVQPYGDTYHYYRTASATHEVCVMPLKDADSVATMGPW